MAYSCKVILDSIGPAGKRLTTLEITLPRIVLAEFNTHRMLSRNSASSRAIPVAKMMQRVKDDPFIPIWWGKNQKGMQASEELEERHRDAAIRSWLVARDVSLSMVEHMAVDLDVHKQIANRLLEPWLWHTIIATATEWENFFALRRHKDAQPEIRRAADMMFEVMENSRGLVVKEGHWHLPLVTNVDEATLRAAGYDDDRLIKISCGRCARVSYLTHDGRRDPEEDINLCDRLMKSGHMSPLEHAARAMAMPLMSGNFCGWKQYRKMLPNEAVFTGEQ